MNREEKNIFIIFSIILSSILLLICCYLLYVSYKYPLDYKESIVTYSKEFDLDPSLVASIINAESRFDKEAVSNKGAVGLMQLMPSTAIYVADILNRDFDIKDLTDADKNILYGCCYLNYLNNKFEDNVAVLASYNAGEGIVKKWLLNKEYSKDGKTLDAIPYQETDNYVKQVLNSVRVYKNKLNN